MKVCSQAEEIIQGDCAFLLGCVRIVPKDILQRNTHNLVIHESDLPKGKGWSPLTWQILEGKNTIPIVLFEAEESVDSGVVYIKKILKFNGQELISELRKKQGEMTVTMAVEFVDSYPPKKFFTQKGKATFYPRRKPENSELDINKTIKTQINLLRVVDNKRYPAFFTYKGSRFILKVSKAKT